jgi:hypothetical protein
MLAGQLGISGFVKPQNRLERFGYNTGPKETKNSELKISEKLRKSVNLLMVGRESRV